MESGSQKHAYLVMAHNNFRQLKMLLQQLNDERNDIYIHIDRKAKVTKEELGDLVKTCNHAKVEFTKRISVNWGGIHRLRQKYSFYKKRLGRRIVTII